MSLDLPEIIRRYFGAQNAHDIDAMVACFASDARVRDEGHVHIGPDAIRAWKKETSAKYRITVEPVECGIEGKTTVVVARVSGAFNGSPANLTYRFSLSVVRSTHWRSGDERYSRIGRTARPCHGRHKRNRRSRCFAPPRAWRKGSHHSTHPA